MTIAKQIIHNPVRDSSEDPESDPFDRGLRILGRMIARDLLQRKLTPREPSFRSDTDVSPRSQE